jgi:hypothetical protein
MTDMPKFPDVFVKLIGEDSNTGNIMGRVTRAMQQEGVPYADQQAFRLAVMNCDSYAAVLQLVMDTVSVGEPADYE